MRKRTRIEVDDQCSIDQLVAARFLLNEMIAAKRDPARPTARKPKSLEELGMRQRIPKALRAAGITTLDELLAENELTLLLVPGIAPRSVRDIQSALAYFGLSLTEPTYEVLP